MLKRNIFAGVISLVAVAGFLGFLCAWIKAPPLIIICAGTMVLAVYDFIQAVKDIAKARES